MVYIIFAILDLITQKGYQCKNNFKYLKSSHHHHHTQKDEKEKTESHNILEMHYPNSLYIPYPFNELHIFGNAHLRGWHMKYDEKEEKFVELAGMNDNKWMNFCTYIYVQAQQRIYAFGGSEDGIQNFHYTNNIVLSSQ